MRSLPPWIGKTDDSPIPPRVKLRIWERCGGLCHITGRKIMPWDKYEWEHIIALCNGGAHSEDNIAPALASAHKKKTKTDRSEKARIDKKRKKFLGIRKPSTFPASRAGRFKKKMSGEVVER